MSDPTTHEKEIIFQKIAFETPLWATFPLPIKQAMLQHKTNLIYIYSKSSLQHFHDMVNMFQNEAVTFLTQYRTKQAVEYNKDTYDEDSKDMNKTIYIENDDYDMLPVEEKKTIDELKILKVNYKTDTVDVLTKIDEGCIHLEKIFGIVMKKRYPYQAETEEETEEWAQCLNDIRNLCHSVKTANDFDWAQLNPRTKSDTVRNPTNLIKFHDIVMDLSLANYTWNSLFSNRKPSKHNNQALLKQLYRARFTLRCVQQSSDPDLMVKVMETFAMLPLPIHGGTKVVYAEPEEIEEDPPKEPSPSPSPPSLYTAPDGSKSV